MKIKEFFEIVVEQALKDNLKCEFSWNDDLDTLFECIKQHPLNKNIDF